MKTLTLISTLFLLSLTNVSYAQGVNENNWQNGDIVFIKSSKISNSLSASDKEKFNCMGIIFVENGHPMVYYTAGEPLKKVSFQEFIDLSVDKKYSIKWLNETGVINEDVIKTMRSYATAKLGTKYDDKENLNSEELYNAEFIWKIYKTTIGTYLCQPKEKDEEAAKKNPTKYLDTKYVSVKDIYKSELLE